MPSIIDLIAPLARTGLTWLSRRSMPKTSGKLTIPGLTAEVEIIRDKWGIPHIYAKKMHDLFFAQGFVHAQDRLWQMELNRLTAHGRLSELFGELALDTDRTVRTFGFNRLGRTDWANAKGEIRETFNAYSEGINAFLNNPGRKLPVEFTLLKHRPEPWLPEDSMAFTRVMIWQLSHAWYGEIVRAELIQAVGAEHAAELDIYYPAGNPTVLPEGIEFNQLDPTGRLKKIAGPFLDRGKGSNAWAISGNKTSTGKPILCNDMHLALSQPGLWYQVHLESENYHVTGVSLPGVPMVLVGHNAKIAWGITLAYTDCEDLYVEEIDPQNPTRYQYQGAWYEAEVIPESIKVKSRTEPHIENVHITRHGPVISDVVSYPSQRLAVRSMALQPCPAFEGFSLLGKATGWDDFVDAMRLIEAPQFNIAYADVEGNIGYWVTGKVPIRAKGDGSVPAPGWTGEFEWIGEVPFEEMPHALNPTSGLIVHTNNRIIGEDYPYFLGNVWMNGYRAKRIETVLNAKTKITKKDCGELQLDFMCLPGLEFVSRLQSWNVSTTDPDARLAIERLRGWDGLLTKDSIPGTIYEVVRLALVRNLLEPGLGPELSLRLMGRGFHPLLFAANEFYGHDTVTMFRLMDNPDSWWVKQAGGRDTLLLKSMKQAVEWLRSELGHDVENWKWGKLHGAIFPHALGLQKPFDKVFDRGPFPIGGDTDTPCQTAVHAQTPYHNKAWSPSYRQIVDMGDLSASMVIIPPGQSGQLGNPHYDDLISPWLEGEYIPMLWEREQIEKASTEKLILK